MNESSLFEIESKYMMPKEYIGKTTKSGGLTKNAPREWTEKEIEFALMLKEKGFSNKIIAQSIYRDSVQVSIKMKRLGKKDGSYNDKHKDEKYRLNEAFVDIINPKSILDVYAGNNSFYNRYDNIDVVTNDYNESFETYYHMESLKLLCMMYMDSRKFDIIDLDPFGSAYDCFDIAIKLAKKGLIITLGELGHKRFNRLDFVGSHYGIKSMKDFTTDTLINHIIKIGERNKKSLYPIQVAEWNGISRVWFTIESLKINYQNK